MNSFSTDLVVRQVRLQKDRKFLFWKWKREFVEWEVVEPLIYRGNTETFTVPIGFVTDFASIPRILWSLVPPYGRYTKAAVLHDHFYVTQSITRRDADGLFRRTMKELGVSRLLSRVMWLAVRIGGGFVWKRRSCNGGV